MRLWASFILPATVLMACGGQATQTATDSGSDARVEVDSATTVDAAPDVPPDGPRVWCADSTLDGGGMLCAPGMICGNSGGVPGNCCCYQQTGAPDYYCPC